MNTIEVTIPAPLSDVWARVLDAEGYPDWLVGARHAKADELWPQLGSSFRHCIGFGPFLVAGSTTVEELDDRRHRLVLRAGMGPAGEARVVIELSVAGAGTRVTMSETPSRGIAAAAWIVARPAIALALQHRNRTSLHRLSDLFRPASPGGPSAAVTTLVR